MSAEMNYTKKKNVGLEWTQPARIKINKISELLIGTVRVQMIYLQLRTVTESQFIIKEKKVLFYGEFQKISLPNLSLKKIVFYVTCLQFLSILKLIVFPFLQNYKNSKKLKWQKTTKEIQNIFCVFFSCLDYWRRRRA